jgi:hypothetical protein
MPFSAVCRTGFVRLRRQYVDGVSVPLLVAVLAAGALAARFNRPLARVHVALFKGSREPPRGWQMLLLRTVWMVAGAAVAVAALFGLADAAGS